jgi:rSAM/selenodomain-associated transferase 2
MAYHLSVIIPTLNEQDNLPQLLADLQTQVKVNLEIIVADGGSTDNTLGVCGRYKVLHVTAPRGRARQLNAGFRKSTGSNLLFLHADSRLRDPALLYNALTHWSRVLAARRTESIAGHFPLKFTRTSRSHRMTFRYMEGKTHFNRINTTNGDQGFLLKRTFFEHLGGFDESQHFLEDQKLAEKIRRQGAWMTLPGRLHTSGRRFEAAGCHRLYILMSMLMALYSTGHMAFFKRASGLYASQTETGHLRLTPYYGAAIRMFVYDLGFTGTIRAWYAIGRYIRQNSWQLFYFFDVLLRTPQTSGAYPLLAFHDKYFGPATDNAVCDTINTFISFFWFMLVLGPYFLVVDTIRPQGPPLVGQRLP